MSNKSLFVDDDPMLLKGIRRQLDDDYDLGTACGPEEGLELVAEAGPYSVIVSDMRMPNMNGVEFLARVRGIHSNSVRIILTGFADLNSTIKAVNDGNIFRFLGKPVENGDLVAALQAGIRQYELVTAEQALVEGTLKGAVKVLSEVLGLVNPTAFGQAARVQRVVSALAHDLEIEDAWELEIAAMLYPLGYVTVPDQILEKVAKGRVLTVEERTVYQRHPQAAQRLLRNIPRLETVADIVACQAFSREDFHRNSNTKRVQDGAHILRLALDYDEAEVASGNSDDALEKLRRNADLYEVGMLNSLERLISAHSDHEATEVPVCELQEGMILANDVLDQRGTLLVAKGHEVTSSMKERLANFVLAGRLKGGVSIDTVSVPKQLFFLQQKTRMNSQQTILLIDDDARLLSALERRLVDEGYQVLTAISAGEAHAMLERNAADVIVCDNRMPGVSGLEFLGRIKRKYASTKRIILSGNVGAAQAFQAMTTHGISCVLTKPCDFDILCSTIREVTGHSGEV